jgi:hypothetical protein
MEAIAERPRRQPGSLHALIRRRSSDGDGGLVGAVNMLVDLTRPTRGGRGTRAARCDRRGLRRRDRQQGSERHRHQLEPRRRTAFRLLRRRSDRPADHHDHPRGFTALRSRKSSPVSRAGERIEALRDRPSAKGRWTGRTSRSPFSRSETAGAGSPALRKSRATSASAGGRRRRSPDACRN